MERVTLTRAAVNRLPRRRWARKGIDAEVHLDLPARGHDPSSDAIGGFYGIAWDELFRDPETEELFVVECYDGTNRSKASYEGE